MVERRYNSIRVKGLRAYFAETGMDYALFAELVDKGLRATQLVKWKVDDKIVFPISYPTMRKYVKIYREEQVMASKELE